MGMPSHCTNTLNTAIVQSSRARTLRHVRCVSFFKRTTVVSIDKTISTTMRPFHVPRLHGFIFGGSPARAWNPVSVKITISS